MNIIFYLLIFCILSIITITDFFIRRNDIKRSYLLSMKKSRIDWKKVIRWYLIANVVSVLSSIDNKLMNYTDVILMPIVLISFLLVYYFYGLTDPTTDGRLISEIDKNDFEIYKKQKSREEKINKILK